MSRVVSGLRIEGVSCLYGQRAVLKNIECGFISPELIIVAGPNGAGKTTLLQILSGELSPSSGRVTLDGKEISQLSRRAIATKIAYLPQKTEFPLHFLVRDLLYCSRYPYRSFWHGFASIDHAAIARAASTFNLEPFMSKSILELSGGEQKRVLLAGMAVQDASFYLLDEPLNNLDPETALIFVNYLRRLKASGKSVIVVAHEFNYFWKHADRLLLLKDGQLLYDGKRRFQEDLFRRVFNVSFTVLRDREEEFLLADE